jgi:Ca2+-binding RTX toxin-like protein
MPGGNGNHYNVVDNVLEVILDVPSGGTSDTVFLSVDGYIVPANIENIVIGESISSVQGNSGPNFLTGNSLDNTLNGGAGADTLAGLEGNDYFIVDNVNDIVQELGGQGSDTVQANVVRFVLPDNVEAMVMGVAGVTGVGNAGNNTIIGNASYNSLAGGNGDDWLSGEGGNDTLDGGLGNDTMVGGAGSDWFVRDSMDDSIDGGAGDGIISEIDGYALNPAFDHVAAGNGVVTITGNSGNNSVIGNSLANFLSGGGGADTLMGRGQSDYYYVDSTNDVVVELNGEGSLDTVNFSVAGQAYTLPNFVERLILTAGTHGTGNSVNNTLSGNGGNNSLNGGAGRDSLSGGGGDDTLLGALATSTGGRGEIDTLTGSAGADRFVLGTSAGALYNDGLAGNTGTADYALITDFNSGEGDRLQLRSGTYYFTASNGSHQDLYMELGTTDEMVARLQGVSLATTPFNSSTAPGYAAFV